MYCNRRCLAYSSFCCTWMHLSTRPCAASLRVFLQELLCCIVTCLSTRSAASVQYMCFCTAPGPVYLHEPVLYCLCLTTIFFVLLLDLSVYKSLCCIWSSLSFTCFDTGSKHQKKLKQIQHFFFLSRSKAKKQNRLSLGFNTKCF